jgi:hypothetical protein
MITDWTTLALSVFDALMVFGILAAMYWMR